MAFRIAAHLKQNRFGVYYFRQVIPPDLRRFFAFKEVSRSTGTSRQTEAAALALRFSASVTLLFCRLRALAGNEKDEIYRTDLIVALDFEKDGTLKSFKTELQPGEEDAARRLVPELLRVAQNPGSGPSTPQTPASPRDQGPTLFPEIEKYLDEQTRGGAWRPQTAVDARGDFEQFKAVLGDIPVTALNHEALNRLRDTLLRLPANINKLPQTRGKPIDEILALGLPAQSTLTVKKKWDRVSAFLSWLEGKGLVEKNYAKGKKPRAKAQNYEKFTRDDLSRLFESPEYQSGTFGEPFQFWLPLLGLFTGARLEELAQLHVADVRRDDCGVWIFEITEEVHEEHGADAGKRLKNASSRRLCPLHPALIEAGLLTYVDDLKSRGYDRVFPELRPDKLGKVSGRASEWFTAYRRSKQVGELVGKSKKNFHSFRHTMNAALQRVGVPQEVREALCGHASNAINVRVYGSQLPLLELGAAIARLDYQIRVPAFQIVERHELARSRSLSRK